MLGRDAPPPLSQNVCLVRVFGGLWRFCVVGSACTPRSPFATAPSDQHSKWPADVSTCLGHTWSPVRLKWVAELAPIIFHLSGIFGSVWP